MQGIKLRNSNIELLRILCMLGVVILHYNNPIIGGGLQAVIPGSINQTIMRILECSCISAVNLFVLISGYFYISNNKRSIYKPISLLFLNVLVKFAFLLVNVYSGQSVFSANDALRCMLPDNWFINLYVVMNLISPFINKVIGAIDSRKQYLLIVILVACFSFEPILIDLFGACVGEDPRRMSFVGLYGHEEGYTIVQFVMMYVIGAVIKKNEKRLKEISKYTYIIPCLIICVIINTVWYSREAISPFAIEYCNPLVILEAIALFMIFIKMKTFNSRVINALAKGAFMVYLIHGNLLALFKIPEYVVRSPMVYVLHTGVTVITIYLFGWFINLLYSLCAKPVSTFIKKHVKIPEYEV